MTSAVMLLVEMPAARRLIGRVELWGRVSAQIAQPDGRRGGCVLLDENPFYAAIISLRTRRN